MPGAWYEWRAGALILNIRVQPRASRDEIAGHLDARLKVRLRAPPVDGKANQQLIRFIAKLCGVSPGKVTLLSGTTGRNKRLSVDSPQRLPQGVAPPLKLGPSRTAPPNPAPGLDFRKLFIQRTKDSTDSAASRKNVCVGAAVAAVVDGNSGNHSQEDVA